MVVVNCAVICRCTGWMRDETGGSWLMIRIAEKVGFQTETPGEVRQRNDKQLLNSCFCYYCGPHTAGPRKLNTLGRHTRPRIL